MREEIKAPFLIDVSRDELRLLQLHSRPSAFPPGLARSERQVFLKCRCNSTLSGASLSTWGAGQHTRRKQSFWRMCNAYSSPTVLPHIVGWSSACALSPKTGNYCPTEWKLLGRCPLPSIPPATAANFQGLPWFARPSKRCQIPQFGFGLTRRFFACEGMNLHRR